jgi:cysteine synthase A
VLEAIGNTPLVAMRRLVGDPQLELWGKLELTNPGGSSKDRPAAAMIRAALTDGLIGPGSTVIESSSGNMGVGLAQACRYFDLRLICVVDSRADPDKLATMRALGAEVRVVAEADGQTADLLALRLTLVRELLAEIPDAFWTDQYSNPANPEAHASGTMAEIDAALDGRIDYLFVATSTVGTLSGCAALLRSRGRQTRLVAVDAVGSVLFGGGRGERRLPGLGAGVEPDHALAVEPDHLVRVDDLGCAVGCRRLVDREAIFAGASSGAVAVAVERLRERIEPGSRCVAILPDGGSGYLDTIYDDHWIAAELGCDAVRLRELVDGGTPEPG